MEKEHCKICLEEKHTVVGTPRINDNFPRFEKNAYRILQCRNCGFYFVAPEIDLSQEEWQALYENDYFEGSQKTKWQIEINKKELKERMSFICDALKTEKGKFLDMGCGEGFMLKEAEKNDFEPYGLDIAYNLCEENKEKYNFFKGSIFEAKYPDDFFSVVYMDSVLEHLPNPVETLAELKRILKPGGVLLFIVPNEDSTMNSFIKFAYSITFQQEKYGKIKPFVTPYHIQGFNKKSLRVLLNKLNLEVLSIKGFGGNYAFWKASERFSKSYYQSMMLYPAGLLSLITGQQIQLLSVVRK